MNIVFRLFCCMLVSSTVAAREWSDASGKHKIEADFVALANDGTVVLRKPAGQLVGVPLSRLSKSDQDVARGLDPPADAPARTSGSGSGAGDVDIEFNTRIGDSLKQAIRAAISKRVSAKVSDIRSAEASKVLEGQLLKVELEVGDEDQGTMSADYTFLMLGEKVNVLSKPSSSGSVPSLKNSLKADFKLAGQADAKQFEAALDALFPLDNFDKEHKAIRQKGMNWEFIRGDFFENLSGFVVKTAKDGTITGVAYSLELPK